MAIDLKTHIGVKVKAARRRKGLTQAELAEKIDKAVETISNIERGYALTGLDTLLEIGRIVGEPITYFFEGFGIARRVSKERLALEEQFRTVLDGLRDDELKLALKLVRNVGEHKRT